MDDNSFVRERVLPAAALDDQLRLLMRTLDAVSVRAIVRPVTPSCPATVGPLYPATLTRHCPEASCPQLRGLPEVVAMADATRAQPQNPFTLCAAVPLDGDNLLTIQAHFAEPPDRVHRFAAGLHAVLMWTKYELESLALEREPREDEEDTRREMVRAQEEEREWLAYELHDGLCQNLVAAIQRMRSLAASHDDQRDFDRALAPITRLIEEGLDQARGLLDELSPPLPRASDWEGLMTHLIDGMERESGLRIETDMRYEAPPEREIGAVIYRIAREAVANAHRHARARDVSIGVRCDGRRIRLEVSDDGVGFDVVAALDSPGVSGLKSMRRRAEVVGGSCEIVSSPGEGTRVVVDLPAWLAGSKGSRECCG